MSVLAARHDDDDDTYIYIYIYNSSNELSTRVSVFAKCKQLENLLHIR